MDERMRQRVLEMHHVTSLVETNQLNRENKNKKVVQQQSNRVIKMHVQTVKIRLISDLKKKYI